MGGSSVAAAEGTALRVGHHVSKQHQNALSLPERSPPAHFPLALLNITPGAATTTTATTSTATATTPAAAPPAPCTHSATSSVCHGAATSAAGHSRS